MRGCRLGRSAPTGGVDLRKWLFWAFRAQNFLRLRRAIKGPAAQGHGADPPGWVTPPSIEHPRHLPRGGRFPGTSSRRSIGGEYFLQVT